MMADVTKSFQVTNLGQSNLVGYATMMKTNSPFSLVGTTNFTLGLYQTQNVTVKFDTSKIGRYTNWVVFTSNGGSVTTSVTGTIIPTGVTNLLITKVE
jgi:hypothetical protein